jgi:hypothetical protein
MTYFRMARSLYEALGQDAYGPWEEIRSSVTRLGQGQFRAQGGTRREAPGGDRTHVVSARLTEALVAAAKERTGITSDTKLIELALASLALDDDFGEWLIAQGGQLPPDFDVDL